ncbi:DUF1554 domain-containing protein [Allochromatium palmeri]|nr:DUF1554 domain-containing protein [Allochromatium palmeri]
MNINVKLLCLTVLIFPATYQYSYAEKPQITVKGGFIKLDVTGGVSPNHNDCINSDHYGRQVYNEVTGSLFICSASGWKLYLGSTLDDHKLVFVTSETYDGNLGGVTGADSKCQAEADLALLTGTFKAWISDETSSPNTRFSKSDVPYILPSGEIVAENYEDLTDGFIENPININPYGDYYNNQAVWTGTRYDGNLSNGTCNNWTIGYGNRINENGIRGSINSIDQGWSSDFNVRCDSNYRLYCFQQ